MKDIKLLRGTMIAPALIVCVALTYSCETTKGVSSASPEDRNGMDVKPKPTLEQDRLDPLPSFIGRWEGKLEVGAQKITIVFTIEKRGEVLAATADSPDQKAYGLRVESVVVNGRAIKLIMPDLLAEFEGELSDDGEFLDGRFVQRGYALALTLIRNAVQVAPEAEPRSAFNWEDVEIPCAGGHILAGTLVWPDGLGPFPVCVLVTGSGAQNRDEELFGKKPFRVLAEALAAAGFASLRYDDRGCYGSTGDFASATTLDFAEDAMEALDFARSQVFFRAGNTGVIGHSEGGIIAAIIAASGTADFSVMLSGPALSGLDVILGQGRAIGAAIGMSEAQLDAAAAVNKSLYALAMSDQPPETIVEKATAMLVTYGVERGEAEAQAQSLASPWFRTFLALDPVPYLAKAQIPVLAVYGSKDLQVLASANEGPARSALAGKPGSDVVVLEGMNHLFQMAESGSPDEYESLPGVFEEEMLDVIIDWIGKVAF